MDLFETARSWLEGGRGVALATVVATHGSVPRHAGARMAVAPDGETVGTIGGGRVEKEVIDVAIEVAGGGQARIVKHHLVRDLAMCCGGSMEMLVEPLARSASVLAPLCVAGSSREVITMTHSLAAPISVTSGASQRAPSWDGNTFVEGHWPRERAVVFGAGHVATALLGHLHRLGFEVVVCDDNEVGAADRVIGAAVVESFELFDVEAAIGRLGSGDFALVLTRDHAIDQRLVEQLLVRTDLTYLGLIGSLGKVGRFRKRILAKGIVDDAGWGRLSAPIGVDVDAETPEEIAIAISAELIRRRAALRRSGE